jgi:hypothetical protein
MTTHSPALLALADTDRSALAATVAAIRDRWPVERVILFGSKARGDDDSESDIDLLVITSVPVDAAEENAMQETAWHAGLVSEPKARLATRRTHTRRWASRGLCHAFTTSGQNSAHTDRLYPQILLRSQLKRPTATVPRAKSIRLFAGRPRSTILIGEGSGELP